MREPAEPSSPLDYPQIITFPVEVDVSNASCNSGASVTAYDELLRADLHEAVRKLSDSITAELRNTRRQGSWKRRGSRKAQDV